MRSGAPSTVNDAIDPASIPTSKPSASAMRAEIGSKTDPGYTHFVPDRIARKRSRRSDQRDMRTPLVFQVGRPGSLPFASPDVLAWRSTSRENRGAGQLEYRFHIDIASSIANYDAGSA